MFPNCWQNKYNNNIYIYIYSTSTYSPNVYICIEYILATIICCICVLVYFVKPYL